MKAKDSPQSVPNTLKDTKENTESRHTFLDDFDGALEYLFSMTPHEIYLQELP
jgi:hypothetical protein